MKVAILGTGIVGDTLGSKCIQCGHEVKMGSRTAFNEKAVVWLKKNRTNASIGTFAEAAAFGDIVFNCTKGIYSLEALKLAGKQNLTGKILIDVANALDTSKGMPTLAISTTDSLGEQIQRAFPDVKVVKALNTVSCKVMVNPDSVAHGDHDIFISGNDPTAKATVTKILKDWFGWKYVTDLGDITSARAAEMLMPVWLKLMTRLQTTNFNFRIMR